ncbi:MAG: serine/threonine-protein kinase [Chlamydiota bacterium]
MSVNTTHQNIEPTIQGFRAPEQAFPPDFYPKMTTSLGLEPHEVEDFDLKDKDAFNQWLDERLEFLAEDLLIGKETLFHLKKEALSPLNEEKLEEFCSFLEKKQKKYGPHGDFRHIMKEARSHYKKLTGRQSINSVNEHTIKKAYRLSLKNLNKAEKIHVEGGTSFQFHYDKSPKVQEEFRTQHFLTAVKNGKLEIIAWSGRTNTAEHTTDVVNDEGLSHEEERPKDPAHLGAGTFGVAQKVLDFTSGKTLAIKIAFPKKGSGETKERAYADIRRENEVINDLSNGYQGRGIQKKYHYEFDFMTKIDGRPFQLIGLLGPFYNVGDLTAIVDGPITDKGFPGSEGLMDMVLQLFEGGQRIHNKGYIHGDIKHANIFINHKSIEKNKGWEAFISDYGGAKKIREHIDSGDKNNFFGSTFTEGNFTETDVQKSEEAFQNIKKAKLKQEEVNKNNEERWVELQQKRDVFAIASSACYLLSGEKPYHLDEEVDGQYFDFMRSGFVVPDASNGLVEDVEDNMRSVCGDEVTDILIKALNEDPDERPSSNQIVDVLKSIIRPASKLEK